MCKSAYAMGVVARVHVHTKGEGSNSSISVRTYQLNDS